MTDVTNHSMALLRLVQNAGQALQQISGQGTNSIIGFGHFMVAKGRQTTSVKIENRPLLPGSEQIVPVIVIENNKKSWSRVAAEAMGFTEPVDLIRVNMPLELVQGTKRHDVAITKPHDVGSSKFTVLSAVARAAGFSTCKLTNAYDALQGRGPAQASGAKGAALTAER